MAASTPLVRQWLLLRTLSAWRHGATIRELAEEVEVSEKTTGCFTIAVGLGKLGGCALWVFCRRRLLETSEASSGSFSVTTQRPTTTTKELIGRPLMRGSRPTGDATELPTAFGFRGGERGPHASRTMMLPEVRDLLRGTSTDVSKADYKRAIMEDNVLGKRTLATRRESYERLGWLYALDPAVPLFRALRYFWDRDPEAQPLLAMLCASARDPLLRMTASTVLQLPYGDTLSIPAMEGAIAANAPGRFSETTQLKIARNAAASWTQSGHLHGRRTKRRTHPKVTPAAVAYALLLGYLGGASGQVLLTTFWAALLDTPTDQLVKLAADASARGWIAYRQSGQVVEVRFPELLTPEEMERRREQD